MGDETDEHRLASLVLLRVLAAERVIGCCLRGEETNRPLVLE
jgi:hypothetical protein